MELVFAALAPLAFLTPFAWIVALISAIFVCFVLENHRGLLTLGTVLLVVFGGIALHLFSWATICAHPLLIPLVMAGYIAAGCVWVWVAWLSFLGLTRDEADEYGDEFDKLPADSASKVTVTRTAIVDRTSRSGFEEKVVALTGEKLAAARAAYIEFRIGFTLPPQVKEHKARIIRYMAYWPFSILRTMLKDPLRRLYNYLYRSFGARLQAMSDKAFAGR